MRVMESPRILTVLTIEALSPTIQAVACPIFLANFILADGGNRLTLPRGWENFKVLAHQVPR